MKNVVAYVRVSTDGQCGEDKFGIESQKEQIIAYCEKNKMDIIEWFIDEGESGAKMNRPEFDRLIYGETSNPPVESVIVAKSDRIARDINIYYYYKMQLKQKNITLISISEDFGQMGVFASMLEAFTLCAAEMERTNISKRTAGGRGVKARKGGYAGGIPPFGYKAVGGNLVIVESEASIVRAIFDLRTTNKLSYDKIAEKLNEMGVVGRNGKPMIFTTVKSILDRERMYRGEYKYGANEWVAGQHESILKDSEVA